MIVRSNFNVILFIEEVKRVEFWMVELSDQSECSTSKHIHTFFVSSENEEKWSNKCTGFVCPVWDLSFIKNTEAVNYPEFWIFTALILLEMNRSQSQLPIELCKSDIRTNITDLIFKALQSSTESWGLELFISSKFKSW